MFQQHRWAVRLIFVLLFLSGLLAIPRSVHADPLQPPDFRVHITWAPPGIGYIVRGATTPPDGGDVFPVYQLGGFGCDYVSNGISLTSHFGFTGQITLEFVNLPAGVTSNTANTLTITGPTPSAGQSPSATLILQAASTAALGDFTVTLRAANGALVHTVDLPIRVVDVLPPCVGDTFGSNPARPDQVTIDRAEFDAGKQELRVEATECCDNAAAMLWATVASTGEVIGMLEFKGKVGNFGGKFEGRFNWPVNPQQIKVISSPRGGWQQGAVTAK